MRENGIRSIPDRDDSIGCPSGTPFGAGENLPAASASVGNLLFHFAATPESVRGRKCDRNSEN
jgi:hypothetical protein